MHTFQQSGLGQPPYNVIHPKQHAIEKGKVFWCEHCGTTIKHRHFVKSSDGKVSVVGIDCLKKTGDEGLVEGVKRLAREARNQEREAQLAHDRELRLAEEKAQNNGKTNAELAEEIDSKIEESIREFIIENESDPVLCSLTNIGFEQSMSHHVYLVRPYTPGQLSAIKKVHTKKVSKARANSKAYKSALLVCGEQVDALQQKITAKHEELEVMRARSRELKYS